jgi:pimeloyl-ACP methyl ester carboxylesterase
MGPPDKSVIGFTHLEDGLEPHCLEGVWPPARIANLTSGGATPQSARHLARKMPAIAMPRVIIIGLSLAAIVYLALCIALFLAQRSFIYYPQPKSTSDDGPPLTLNIDGEQILVATRFRTGAEAVIYFGGNAEDVSRSLATLEAAFPDRSLYALHYRGYGGSTGKPSEKAIIADALALYDRVHVDHPRIVLIGRSLGSGVAIHVASKRPTERLVLVTPYDSILRLAANQFPFFPIRLLLLDKYESSRYAPQITAPTQLIAAQNDEVIPFESTESLFSQFPPGRAILTAIPGVGHNTVSESTDYVRLLRATP